MLGSHASDSQFLPVEIFEQAPSYDETPAADLRRCPAITSLFSKIGCVPQSRKEWVKSFEVDSSQHVAATIELAERMAKVLPWFFRMTYFPCSGP